MLVKQEMTSPVESTVPSASVREAAQKMKKFNVGALPVCENDKLIGIVTDRDITIRLTAAGKDPAFTTVREIMTSSVERCREDEQIESVARRMETKKIRRIAVVDQYERLVGMLSLGDLAVRGSNDVACKILEKVSAAA